MRRLTSAWLESLCETLCPERPPFVLFNCELPENRRIPPCVLGATARGGLDVVLYDALGQRLQKKGRRPVIIVNAKQCAVFARFEHPFVNERISARRKILRTLAHEVAHVVADDPQPGDESAEFAVLADAALAKFVSAPPPAAIEQPIPWQAHDAGFARLLFHVMHRLRPLVDVPLPFGDEYDPRAYALAHREDQYRDSLGDEPERLTDVPLTQLSAIAPPERFVELWRADLRAWFSRIDDPSYSQIDALARAMQLFPNDNQTPAAVASCEALNPPAK